MIARQQVVHGEDEESYFVSMTDVIIGLLFIFIIMLMFFAMRFQEEAQKHKVATTAQERLIENLTDAEKARNSILEGLQAILKSAGVNVTIVRNEGILRLPEEILFDSSKWELNTKGRSALRTLATALDLVLPCYTRGPRSQNMDCPDTRAKIDAIFIEGHADNAPMHRATPSSPRRSAPRSSQFTVPQTAQSSFLFSSEQNPFFAQPSNAPGVQPNPRRVPSAPALPIPPQDNLDLSALRATSTFRELLAVQPGLTDYRSPDDKRVLSVSGYGEYRPVPPEDGESPERYRQRNRRIDLRILMATPKSEEAKQMQRRLEAQP